MRHQRRLVRPERTWVPAGRRIRIADHDISAGLCHVGEDLRTTTGETEPALIDPTLPVAAGSLEDLETEPLAYHRLAPAARTAYLAWLARGRRGEVPTGLVLLFCFGLERRVLLDAADETRLAPGHRRRSTPGSPRDGPRSTRRATRLGACWPGAPRRCSSRGAATGS